MTDYYLRSTTGADVNSGLTWALAKATLAGVSLVATVAGDRVFISQAHAENLNTNQNYGGASSDNNPVRYICANDATGEPPTAGATTAVVQTGNAISSWSIQAGHWYGITFEIGVGNANNVSATFNNGVNCRYENCTFKLNATGASGRFQSIAGTGRKHFLNSNFRFANSAHNITIGGADFHWQGGSIVAGGVTPIAIFGNYVASSANRVLIEGVDFSALAATVHFFQTVHQAPWQTIVRNCKLPAAWSGNLVNGVNFVTVGCRVCMYNCWNSAARYKVWIEDFAGTIRDETSIVRLAGNTTSLKLTANAKNLNGQPTTALRTDEFVRRNTNIGTPITVSAYVLSDTATPINDSQAWIEVEYLSDSGSPISTHITDGLASPIATPATQAAGPSWNSGAMTNPDSRKLSVTLTPQRIGYIHAKVCWNKASSILYVDPILDIT